jgi:hypothetical protein
VIVGKMQPLGVSIPLSGCTSIDSNTITYAAYRFSNKGVNVVHVMTILDKITLWRLF